MVTDEDERRELALSQLDSVVERRMRVDDELLDAMAYALECKATRNEVARRVPVLSRPTVLSVLNLIDLKDEVNRALAEAGIPVPTSDGTEAVWLFIVSKPRRGLTIQHDSNTLEDGGEPGSPGRRAAAERVAGKVVPVLYDAGFELAAGKLRLTRDDAATAFGDPESTLWVLPAQKA
ncbi:hypothetical protein [Nocardia camponoti]|uniref:Uncharacterized protein n=1 Tax=Nocardia camponoti TaxID=1616106 RepID=A0A917QUJ4_9NOCA|nr:hypothetical protein [Nocardia camponoti]GGK69205.1 hypothetical protein GCM10011591_46660 [Nocardia camponoti]